MTKNGDMLNLGRYLTYQLRLRCFSDFLGLKNRSKNGKKRLNMLNLGLYLTYFGKTHVITGVSDVSDVFLRNFFILIQHQIFFPEKHRKNRSC